MFKHRVDRRLLSIPIGLQHRRLIGSALVALTLVVGLAGCAVNQAKDEAGLLASVAGEPLQRADALLTEGKAPAAAQAYLAISAGVGAPARAELQLKAARAYLSVGDTRSARDVVGQITRPQLTAEQRDRLVLVEADLALLDGRPTDAIARLQAMNERALPRDLKVQRLGTLAAAQRLANQPVAAAESLIALDRLLDSRDARLLNQVSLVSTLSTLGSERLRELARSGKGPMRGWAEIALLAGTAGADPAGFKARFEREGSKRLGHPALPGLADAYVAMLSGGYAEGDRVAVLLPRGGRFAGAAASVREGIEASSRADRSGDRPALAFVDSTSPARAGAAHAKAVEGGAAYVIGPLEKEAVDSLAAGPALTVPTLALNQTSRDDRSVPNLFQFSLSPENEATEAANKAAAMGLKRAFLLYPEGPWGERLAGAFRIQWGRLGGSVAGASVYNPTARSFDQPVAALLSKADGDLVFLAATSELARRLYPAVRSVASSIPVISTSHVYSGVFSPKQDAVLDGLYFVDIPWMLDGNGEGALSRRRLSGSSFEVANPLARLYAMGIDAYRITPRLPALAKSPGAFYPGQTGGLSIDASGRIQRQLALGRFTASGVLDAEDSVAPAAEARTARK